MLSSRFSSQRHSKKMVMILVQFHHDIQSLKTNLMYKLSLTRVPGRKFLPTILLYVPLDSSGPIYNRPLCQLKLMGYHTLFIFKNRKTMCSTLVVNFVLSKRKNIYFAFLKSVKYLFGPVGGVEILKTWSSKCLLFLLWFWFYDSQLETTPFFCSTALQRKVNLVDALPGASMQQQ